MTLRAPFRFDIVGSFLRPARLKKAREQFAKGEIAALDLKQVEDEEIARLIEKQKAAGLHTLTDGEFRRSYWHLDFFWGLQGITHIELDHGYFSMEKRPPKARPSSPAGSVARTIPLWNISST